MHSSEACRERPQFESRAVACRRVLVDRLKMAFGRQTGMQAYARDGVRMYDPFHPLGGHGMDGLGFGTANHHGLGRISSYCSLAMEQLSGPDIVDQSAFRDAVWTDLAQNV
jgi:hypothetical protein